MAPFKVIRYIRHFVLLIFIKLNKHERNSPETSFFGFEKKLVKCTAFLIPLEMIGVESHHLLVKAYGKHTLEHSGQQHSNLNSKQQ